MFCVGALVRECENGFGLVETQARFELASEGPKPSILVKLASGFSTFYVVGMFGIIVFEVEFSCWLLFFSRAIT